MMLVPNTSLIPNGYVRISIPVTSDITRFERPTYHPYMMDRLLRNGQGNTPGCGCGDAPLPIQRLWAWWYSRGPKANHSDYFGSCASPWPFATSSRAENGILSFSFSLFSSIKITPSLPYCFQMFLLLPFPIGREEKALGCHWSGNCFSSFLNRGKDLSR